VFPWGVTKECDGSHNPKFITLHETNNPITIKMKSTVFTTLLLLATALSVVIAQEDGNLRGNRKMFDDSDCQHRDRISDSSKDSKDDDPCVYMNNEQVIAAHANDGDESTSKSGKSVSIPDLVFFL
jgi:hypothetical protein